uniref:Uncharacterized protein MANES_03G141900 n=1 Tax=Rhizophora mucronata TaxID=61149 RepID=A0A2P2NHN3_RHIMU
MTGVTSAPWRDSCEFDRFDIRYLKVKDSAEKFAVVQFGVCPFRWDAHRNSFISHPHNFFVFPHRQEHLSGGGGGPHEFLCQTTSMDFLAKYQFDFNTCINEGVSYLSRAQENEALERLNSRYVDEFFDLKEVPDMPLVSITDVLFSERMKNLLREWRDRLLRERNGMSWLQVSVNESKSKEQLQTVFYKMRPALCLNGFTSHQLKLIQLVTKKHFGDLIYVRHEAESPCLQHYVVYTDSDSDRNLLMKEVKDDYYGGAEKKIKEAIGFRHVIDLLSAEQKLIVGHNCFLDIAHVCNKFLHALPLTAEDFVFSVNKYFPYIVDTKILLNAHNVIKMKKSSTSLSSAFSLLCPQIALGFNKSTNVPLHPCVNVEVEVDNTRSCQWSSGVKHEAGYDAFMTGCVFAQACSHLGIDFKHHSPTENLVHNKKLQKHLNLLYLSWTSGDIIDLNSGNMTTESLISKTSPKILFENLVLFWGFPSKLKRREIKECLSKVLGALSVVSVHRLDETAVFVQFSKAEFVSKFLVLKESLERSDDVISALHPLSKLLEGGNTCAAGYETYKEICSSPISKVLFADQAAAIGIRWKTKLVESSMEAQTVCKKGYDKGNAAQCLVSIEKSKIDMKKPVADDPPSSNEVIDTFYAAEVAQITASKL